MLYDKTELSTDINSPLNMLFDETELPTESTDRNRLVNMLYDVYETS